MDGNLYMHSQSMVRLNSHLSRIDSRPRVPDLSIGRDMFFRRMARLRVAMGWQMMLEHEAMFWFTQNFQRTPP